MQLAVALAQLCSSDDPGANLPVTLDLLARAATTGAQLFCTPEVTNCVSASRAHQQQVLQTEAQDTTLAALRAAAQRYRIWVLIGSLALKTDDPQGRFANRSFLIDPTGAIVARYDKIHMFDVAISETETYRESDGFRPGGAAVLAQSPWGGIGLSICYDLRFPQLYRSLAQAGAAILTVPAAFSPVTGAAHWHMLLRARAIETGCFILAPAQTGQHSARKGRARQTYGHSLIVAPWGDVVLDMGTEPGLGFARLDMAQVATARRKVPALGHDRAFAPPDAAQPLGTGAT